MRIWTAVAAVLSVVCPGGAPGEETGKADENGRKAIITPARPTRCTDCGKCRMGAKDARKTSQCGKCGTFHVYVSAQLAETPFGGVRYAERIVETKCPACAGSLSEKGLPCAEHDPSRGAAARVLVKAMEGMSAAPGGEEGEDAPPKPEEPGDPGKR